MEEFNQRPNNSKYKVYVIVCTDTRKMYVGITSDIKRRIVEHQNPGGVIHDNDIERYFYGEIAWANHRESALQLETFFMDKLCAISSGFNKRRSIIDK
jgi:predicted GIY-YIG superfamily endonuclease